MSTKISSSGMPAARGGGTPYPRPGLLDGPRRLPEHHLPTPSGGEHELGTVLTPTVQDHVDGGASAYAGAHRYPFQHFDVGGPVLDRVAVHRRGTWPGAAGLEQQTALAQRYPQQVRQARVRLGVTGDDELCHDIAVCHP